MTQIRRGIGRWSGDSDGSVTGQFGPSWFVVLVKTGEVRCREQAAGDFVLEGGTHFWPRERRKAIRNLR